MEVPQKSTTIRPGFLFLRFFSVKIRFFFFFFLKGGYIISRALRKNMIHFFGDFGEDSIHVVRFIFLNLSRCL